MLAAILISRESSFFKKRDELDRMSQKTQTHGMDNKEEFYKRTVGYTMSILFHGIEYLFIDIKGASYFNYMSIN